MTLSRSSSAKSLSNLFRRDRSLEREIEIENIEDRAPDIPPYANNDDFYEFNAEEAGDIPEYYRDTTNQHPLGRLFLRLAATNIELCKKAKLETRMTLILEICVVYLHKACNLSEMRLEVVSTKLRMI